MTTRRTGSTRPTDHHEKNNHQDRSETHQTSKNNHAYGEQILITFYISPAQENGLGFGSSCRKCSDDLQVARFSSNGVDYPYSVSELTQQAPYLAHIYAPRSPAMRAAEERMLSSVSSGNPPFPEGTSGAPSTCIPPWHPPSSGIPFKVLALPHYSYPVASFALCF